MQLACQIFAPEQASAPQPGVKVNSTYESKLGFSVPVPAVPAVLGLVVLEQCPYRAEPGSLHILNATEHTQPLSHGSHSSRSQAILGSGHLA